MEQRNRQSGRAGRIPWPPQIGFRPVLVGNSPRNTRWLWVRNTAYLFFDHQVRNNFSIS